MQRVRVRGVAAAGAAVAAAVLAVAACSSSSTTAPASSSGGGSSNLSGTLNGSGSTFQLTFQQTAIQNFKSVQSNMTVNYGGGGSGKGRTDLASNVVQYAGSDTAPIPSDEVANFKGKTVLYFPVIVGPITVSYNLSGVSSLKLDGPVIAGLFDGSIKSWNDPKIAALNPGVKLPNTTVVIARRSDSSGTTANFSQFLVDAAPGVWKLGTSSKISWPANSRGGNGNGGVAQIVKTTAGAVGYVDYSDAKASGLTFASVKNKDGSYVAPSVQSATTAADNATVASDLTFSGIWTPGAGSYPITYQSFVLVYQAQSSSNTAKMLQAYVGYLLGDGQKTLSSLNYAPLPASIDQKAKAQLPMIGSSSSPSPTSS